MLLQTIKLRRVCIYIFPCTVMGGFLFLILLYREYHVITIVRRMDEPFLLKEVNCSGLVQKDIPVWSTEGVQFYGTHNKMKFLQNYKNPCWHELLTYGQENDESLRENIECPIKLRCLPYFMIIGQPKSASTDLYFRLSLHPQIEPATLKGPHWWTRKRYKGVTFDTYVSLFDKAAATIHKRAIYNFQNNVITGEGSTSTLWDTFGIVAPSYDKKTKLLKQELAEEIKMLLPEVKLIIILRDPVERLYSDYLYFTNGSRKSPKNFHTLAYNSVMVFNNCTEFYTVSYCLHDYYVRQQLKVRLNLGIYAVYLQEWYQVFPKDQILVINFDDYVSNMKECLINVFKYLKLRELNYGKMSEIVARPPLNVNQKANRYGNMLPETRRLLHDFYSNFNTQLALLLDDSRFLWDRHNYVI